MSEPGENLSEGVLQYIENKCSYFPMGVFLGLRDSKLVSVVYIWM